MRAFCTVSAPLEVCAPPTRPLCPGARFLALRLLGTPQARTLYFLVEAKSRVREVYAQTCLHFAKQGMLDTELFGLAVLTDGEYLFADPESKLSKYGPKSWRSSHTHGLDANGRPLLELHFRVQFYIESPLMLRDETSRHYYYLQLKANAVSRDVPKECSEQSLLLLGGLALQADLGDSPEEQSTDYFRHEEYIPAAMHSSWGASALNSCHREYRAMSRADAETHYIREACGLHEAINAHMFRMKSTKNDACPGSVWLAVYAKGIKIMGDTSLATTFLWPTISKLSFERKKFEIRSGDNKITLFASSDEKNKMLLALCRETHQFSMKIAPRLTEAIKREEEESSCIHACYMYSRSLNLPYNKNKNDQRISVISSTSSNTTSGIISDRVHSEDELEIMINSPPAVPIAAPSTESLALAHLLDRPSVSRQASSVGQVSLKELEDTLAALSVRSMSSESTEPQERNTTTIDRTSNDTDSPGSQHNISSQCSSTCSTVVVATETATLPTPPQTNTRRHSTCSSLELGFSHTAQNSALSEVTSTCLNNDDDDEEGSSLGVYTLAHTAPPTETSGVYTMNSSEMAESESHESSHYGSFQPNESIANMDSVDGDDFRHRLSSDATTDFRVRSDSNVSASGSFRGDGSDPTDNKHALLSAEELTDLIVGRGTYPNRKTVSNTLDSDCDYVTLPLPLEGDSYIQGHQDTAPTEEEFELDILTNPPAPPKRINSAGRSSLANIVPARRSPPPYNARHETTGLCGPAVREEAPAIPLRDPPPYPQQPTPRAPPSVPVPATTTHPSVIPEEAAARFITTRPHINILKAHTSVVGEKPSFAAPTVQPPTPAVTPTTMSAPTTIGIPIVPYSLHTPHKSMSAIPPPHPPYLEAPKSSPRTCVLLPVIKPRQYLPPPPQTPRQPPPPPPPQLATVYSSQLARSQIELYQQQLYSDVDYVIYPIQDPAVSQQEYLDAKQGSILAAMAQSPPPPPYLAYHAAPSTSSWDTCKGHAIYRSTPYLPMAVPLSNAHSRYASTQNLSDSYVQLPGAYSPLYSPSVASLCSSYEPPPPLPLRPRPVSTTSIFSRSRSDDNILNSIDTLPRARRLPPPPPPIDAKRSLKPPIPTPTENLQVSASTSKAVPVPSPAKSTQAQINGSVATGKADSSTSPPTIDIHALREKSKNLDLPLIAALCNDRSLLKQTKAFVMPRHPRCGGQIQGGVLSAAVASHTAIKGKYPVSGLSTVQLAKPRKSSVSHRHPSDKLPPLPCQCQTKPTEGNNYVMDPTPTPIKHKSFNSQPST
uniref:Putative membrane-associated protein tyrosine phosphatase ptp-bas n=1 Tax=Phlebotomus kandelakii TaxID=1109342 RepID=A0A6B2EC04_9DIPT